MLAGIALAVAETGTFAPLVAAATLLAAAAIQIGTNLHNDAADFERGTDTPDRVGPARATAQGWFTARQVRTAAHLTFGLALLIGLLLVVRGGWPIFLIGVAALVSGYAYTGGPKPIAYGPFGEVYVLAFFGVAAVAGSFYLQTLTLDWPALVLGFVPRPAGGGRLAAQQLSGPGDRPHGRAAHPLPGARATQGARPVCPPAAPAAAPAARRRDCPGRPGSPWAPCPWPWS